MESNNNASVKKKSVSEQLADIKLADKLDGILENAAAAVKADAEEEEVLSSLSAEKLRTYIEKYGLQHKDCVDMNGLKERARVAWREGRARAKQFAYKLCQNTDLMCLQSLKHNIEQRNAWTTSKFGETPKLSKEEADSNIAAYREAVETCTYVKGELLKRHARGQSTTGQLETVNGEMLKLGCSLGSCFMKVGDFKTALTEFRRAVANGVPIGFEDWGSSIYDNIGSMLYRMGNLKEAEKAWNKAVKLNPQNGDAHYNCGRLKDIQGNFEGALSSYRAAIKNNPKDVHAHSAVGNILWKQKGDSDAALCAFRAAVNAEPRYAEAHNNIGCILLEKGDISGALVAKRKAIAEGPTNPIIQAALYRMVLDLTASEVSKSEVDNIITIYQEAVKLHPQHPMKRLVSMSVSAVLLKHGRDQEADDIFLRKIRGSMRVKADDNTRSDIDGKGHTETFEQGHKQCELGHALKNQKDFAGAAQAWRKSVDIDIKNGDADMALNGYSNLVAALTDSGDFVGSISTAKKALKYADSPAASSIDRDFFKIGIYANLGRAYLSNSNYVGAVTACRTAIELFVPHLGESSMDLKERGIDKNDTMAIVHMNLGMSLYYLGDFDGATAVYKIVAALGFLPGMEEEAARFGFLAPHFKLSCAGDNADKQPCALCGLACSRWVPASKKCARCHSVPYCSKNCQRRHWRDGHRHACKTVADTRAWLLPSRSLNQLQQGVTRKAHRSNKNKNNGSAKTNGQRKKKG